MRHRCGLLFLIAAAALLLPACGDNAESDVIIGTPGRVTPGRVHTSLTDPAAEPATTGRDASPEPVPAPSADVAFSFQWEFWARRTDELGSEVREPVTPQTSLPAGNPLYMRVGLNGSCHVYVLTKGPGGMVQILYPKAPVAAPQSGPHTILRKRSKLDAGTGKRRYYVFAAPQPLKNLEAHIADLRSADDANRADRQSALLAEVQTLRKAHEQLKSATTKPATIGGTVRGSENAVEISATGVYVRTYTIAIE